jgi:hypothetical protein
MDPQLPQHAAAAAVEVRLRLCDAQAQDMVIAVRHASESWFYGGKLLHVDTFAHNKCGIAQQDKSRRPETYDLMTHAVGTCSHRSAAAGGCYKWIS